MEWPVPVSGGEERRTPPSGLRIVAGEGAGSSVWSSNPGLVTSSDVEEATRVARETALAALTLRGIGSIFGRCLDIPLRNLPPVSSTIAEGHLVARETVGLEGEIARLGSIFDDMSSNTEAPVFGLDQVLRQNQKLFFETIKRLAAAIDAMDPYTRGHSERVSSYSTAISRHLGLAREDVFRVHIAAMLHDVGKLGIRKSILTKPGRLSDREFEIMRRHPSIGANILSPIQLLEDIVPGVRNHHETWDGKGYPDRLAGEDISLVARIIGVADTFDAMTSNRSYQHAMTPDSALSGLRFMSGTRFDPVVVDAFTAAVESGDINPATLSWDEAVSTERFQSRLSAVPALHQVDGAIAKEGLSENNGGMA